ncbi:MAG: ChbG/HpnK family deacetylase [Paludibacteraceae bacterium]|nr:ChbG/HpnK family deacetylase [Paludibacteraceae bacterium]
MKIILNADDFGKSPERNRAIDDSFKIGLIRSAGLIVTGKHLQDAVKYINNGDYVEKVHLHINFSTSPLKISEGSEDAPLTSAIKKDPLFCIDGKFKPYKGLPRKLSDILKWKEVYKEIIAQYNKFKEVTEGKGNYEHIDFHLWYNLTWPVSIALNVFTRKYHIKSVRYIGLHQKKSLKNRVLRIISWNPRVICYPATNIDYFLSKYQTIKDYKTIELYTHPTYKDGVLLDDSPSYLKHDRQPMLQQIQSLKEIDDIEFLSWENAF